MSRSVVVGTSQVPRSFISASASSVSIEPCSMEFTPAAIAATIPSGPCACAATRSPCRAASSTTASISASESCCAPTVASCESTPAVAQILITLAPYFAWCRTAAITSSGPSAIPCSTPRRSTPGAQPVSSQCPPVMPMAWPAGIMRGPGTQPSSMARMSATSAKSDAPRSRTVVKPARSVIPAFRAPRSARSPGVSRAGLSSHPRS